MRERPCTSPYPRGSHDSGPVQRLLRNRARRRSGRLRCSDPRTRDQDLGTRCSSDTLHDHGHDPAGLADRVRQSLSRTRSRLRAARAAGTERRRVMRACRKCRGSSGSRECHASRRDGAGANAFSPEGWDELLGGGDLLPHAQCCGCHHSLRLDRCRHHHTVGGNREPQSAAAATL